MILYLEDDANMRRHMVDLLRAKGYAVKDYRRFDQGKEYFGEHYDEVSCVITDLNMSDAWLGEFRGESDGGILSGWVFLQHFVYNKKPDMPTIIYSGYISSLVNHLEKTGQISLLNKKNIACVGKGAAENEGFFGLLSALERLHIERGK